MMEQFDKYDSDVEAIEELNDEEVVEEDMQENEIEFTPKIPFTLPKITENSIGKFYCVYFTNDFRYYWGKVTKVFTVDDEDEESIQCEMSFLKKKYPGSFEKGLRWVKQTPEELLVVNSKYVYHGPGEANFKGDLIMFNEEEPSNKLIQLKKAIKGKK